MERYLIDTNVVSDFFASALPSNSGNFIDGVIDSVPNLSVITQIELLCWNTGNIIENNVRDFISDSNILDITPDVISHCVALRRTKKIKTPDAIIAATALANGYTLITNNEKDFAKIEGLKVVNPHKM